MAILHNALFILAVWMNFLLINGQVPRIDIGGVRIRPATTPVPNEFTSTAETTISTIETSSTFGSTETSTGPIETSNTTFIPTTSANLTFSPTTLEISTEFASTTEAENITKTSVHESTLATNESTSTLSMSNSTVHPSAVVNTTLAEMNTTMAEINATLSVINTTLSMISTILAEVNATSPINTTLAEVNSTLSLISTTVSTFNAASVINTTLSLVNTTMAEINATSVINTTFAEVNSTLSLINTTSAHESTPAINESTSTSTLSISNSTIHPSTVTGTSRIASTQKFDCKGKADGYYVEKCESVYYSCVGGISREFHCPADLVFDSNWLSCESPADAFICTGTHRPLTTHTPAIPINSTGEVTSSPLNCHRRQDGIYRDPDNNCSHVFYYCAHQMAYRNLCPGNLFYDHEFQRCDLWINVFDCSGKRKPVVNATTVEPHVHPTDFDCAELDDGDYANPKNACSPFYYICANSETYQQDCPDDLFYDPDFNICDGWVNIFACSGVVRNITTPSTPVHPPSIPGLEFDCTSKVDGAYLKPDDNGCSSVYFRCVGGVTYKLLCPPGLFYDITMDRCDYYESVFNCSGQTRPVTTTTVPSNATTELPPALDCRLLHDGDYADPEQNCSHIYYTCVSGLAIRRHCPAKTYYDSVWRICERRSNVPSCTGKSRPITTTPPANHTRPPTYSFDCTKLDDGNYAANNCSNEFWSCVGGTTFHRNCPVGFIYDTAIDVCDYPSSVPQCGGVRLPSVAPPVTAETPGFDCKFRSNDNYIDPEADNGCSEIFYSCANGKATKVHCPSGLFYDGLRDTCDSLDKVPACTGSNRTTAPEIVTTGPFTTFSNTTGNATTSQGNEIIFEHTNTTTESLPMNGTESVHNSTISELPTTTPVSTEEILNTTFSIGFELNSTVAINVTTESTSMNNATFNVSINGTSESTTTTVSSQMENATAENTTANLFNTTTTAMMPPAPEISTISPSNANITPENFNMTTMEHLNFTTTIENLNLNGTTMEQPSFNTTTMESLAINTTAFDQEKLNFTSNFRQLLFGNTTIELLNATTIRSTQVANETETPNVQFEFTTTERILPSGNLTTERNNLTLVE